MKWAAIILILLCVGVFLEIKRAISLLVSIDSHLRVLRVDSQEANERNRRHDKLERHRT